MELENRIAEINKQITKLQAEKTKLEEKAYDIYQKQKKEKLNKELREQFVADLIKKHYSLEKAIELANKTPIEIVKEKYYNNLSKVIGLGL